MDGLTPGRMVHYVMTEIDAAWEELSDGRPGAHRAAVVVSVAVTEAFPVTANLHVHTDSSHVLWRRNVPYSEGNEPGTWHWIEKA